MKKSTLHRTIASVIVSSIVFILGITPVSAEYLGIEGSGSTTLGGTGIGAKAQATIATRIEKGKSRADQEINRRIESLTNLKARINSAKRLSADQKTSLSLTLDAQISTLTSLKAKIDADTDIDTLKTDIKSIAGSYRIFLLILPQGRIAAMADGILTLSDSMTALGTKLQTRITAAQNAGKDVSSLQAALTDFNAKIADAKVQAEGAVSDSASLTPDNGDPAKLAANNQALQNARMKLKAGAQDLRVARQDAKTIIMGLKAFHLETSTSSTTVTQ
jgi:hypothetical protein